MRFKINIVRFILALSMFAAEIATAQTLPEGFYEPMDFRSGLTYTEDIAPILKSHCVTCHNTMAMIPDFSKYKPVYDLREKILDRAYIRKNMPPGNLSKMTDDERELIALWIEEGAAE